MPWEVAPVSELRLAFIHLVETLHSSVAEACRKFGVSRKTGYKWLGRYRAAPEQPLADRSRRPAHSPRRTEVDLEARILDVRREFGWGPRKIRAFLRAKGLTVPSVRTVGNILRRCGCIVPRTDPSPCVQSFERSAPNQL